VSEPIRIFSHADEIPEDQADTRCLKALMLHGTTAYIANARLDIKALKIDNRIVPLVINPGMGEYPTVCSPYLHYFTRAMQAFRQRHSKPLGTTAAVLGFPYGALLRYAAIERAVFLNNWLVSVSTAITLSSAQVHAATDALVREYPQYAIVIRSVNPFFDPALQDSVVENGYHLVRSRRIYVIDCAARQTLRRKNVRHDLALLRKSSYRVVDCHNALQTQASRLSELYCSLYMVKHSKLNPQFTPDFFRVTLKENILIYRALERDGRIDGFVAFSVHQNRITAVAIGYDCGLPQKIGLYRMLIAILIAEAAERNTHLNLGGGVANFKMLRGAAAIEEYDAVYDGHLPARRRLAWRALAMQGRVASSKKLMSI